MTQQHIVTPLRVYGKAHWNSLVSQNGWYTFKQDLPSRSDGTTYDSKDTLMCVNVLREDIPLSVRLSSYCLTVLFVTHFLAFGLLFLFCSHTLFEFVWYISALSFFIGCCVGWLVVQLLNTNFGYLARIYLDLTSATENYINSLELQWLLANRLWPQRDNKKFDGKKTTRVQVSFPTMHDSEGNEFVWGVNTSKDAFLVIDHYSINFIHTAYNSLRGSRINGGNKSTYFNREICMLCVFHENKVHIIASSPEIDEYYFNLRD